MLVEVFKISSRFAAQVSRDPLGCRNGGVHVFHELVFGTIRDVISYHLGLAFLRAVSNGRYPPEPVSENHRTKVEVVGIVLLVCLIIGVVLGVGALL